MDSMQKKKILKTNTKFGYLLGIENIFYPKPNHPRIELFGKGQEMFLYHQQFSMSFYFQARVPSKHTLKYVCLALLLS